MNNGCRCRHAIGDLASGIAGICENLAISPHLRSAEFQHWRIDKKSVEIHSPGSGPVGLSPNAILQLDARD